jgi:hypothetical protein
VESRYDAASRLTGLAYKLGGSTLWTLAYLLAAASGRVWHRVALPAHPRRSIGPR